MTSARLGTSQAGLASSLNVSESFGVASFPAPEWGAEDLNQEKPGDLEVALPRVCSLALRAGDAGLASASAFARLQGSGSGTEAGSLVAVATSLCLSLPPSLPP